MGKITLGVSMERNENPENIVLVFSVKDTGHGMSKEQLIKMFEEYTRFNSENKNAIEGTGLGLAITQRLLKLMNGKMHVDSKEGKGSDFTIKFPQIKVDDEILSPEIVENLKQFRTKYTVSHKRGQIVRDPMPYGKVLIVDDVETNLFVARGLLKLYRLEIETLMSSIEALELIKNGREYDVIFMDHMMPDMDGIETTRLMRESGYTKPIVALTANAVAGQAEVFLQNGFDDFISKPIDIRQLNSILNRLIRDVQPEEVVEAARKQNFEVAHDRDDIEESIELNALLIDSFIRDVSHAIMMLDSIFEKEWYLNEDKVKKYIVAVHGVKSSLQNMNEKEVAKLALILETAGRNTNYELLKEFSKPFVAELKNLRKKFQIIRREMNTYNEDSEDIESIKIKIQKIINMCADYDRKGVLDTVASIRSTNSALMGIIEIISNKVTHSDFEDAEQLAKDYLDRLNSNGA
jgi:CheY-like chemotaxis protein